MSILPTLVGYILFLLAVCHALLQPPAHRLQRLLMLLALFAFGTLIEYEGVTSGGYTYPREALVNLGVVPLSVSLAWVGIIYSVMVLAERLELSWYLRILATTLIAISLDWGMDPVATRLGAWKWANTGPYFGVPAFNFIGWFFIPIAFLLAYGLGWDREKHRPRLLGLREVDHEHGWQRNVYTLLIVPPLGLGLLLAVSLPLAKLPLLHDLPLLPLVIWAVLSVLAASILVLTRREGFYRSHPADLIPPVLLAFIALCYVFFGFTSGQPGLGWLMLACGLPLWLTLVFTLVRKKEPVPGPVLDQQMN